MMQLICPRCRRTLEYAGDPPSFCGYCGHALAVTQVLTPTPCDPAEAATLAPDPKTSTIPPPAETIGGYKLLRRLGGGGMGEVFEAEEPVSGRRVAVKIISSEFVGSPETVERFRQEGRLASKVVHPRSVFVIAADEDQDRPYIVMELMPGETLQDLVREQGPLAPEDAVRKILDVMEGLREAHRLGLIHRDVKPSNCFLEESGRVKVGDFGLAKALAGDVHLTHTGAFLGTPLYASPEQVRRDPLDQQTDVYSVAATLYFLLTARAPFEGGDVAATVARIVSDPPPSLRTLRPDIPAALEKVVLKGLERQRERRWRNLESLRRALLPFLPGEASLAGLGLRFSAFLVDCVPLVVALTMFEVLSALWLPDFDEKRLGFNPFNYIVPGLYLTVMEGIWGWSLGKWLLRLRVYTRDRMEPPGLARALLRTTAFLLLANLPVVLVPFEFLSPIDQDGPSIFFRIAVPVLYVAGYSLMLGTMRSRKGMRGLHEFISGTRVVRLPSPRRRGVRRTQVRPVQSLQAFEGMPSKLGAFEIAGALRRTAESSILIGRDSNLDRQAWILLRPSSDPPLPDQRRQIDRRTRPRWLASGHIGEFQWDAFLAPEGCPLPDVVSQAGPLTWSEFRSILEELTDELETAFRDNTLPAALNPEQIWIRSNGPAELVEIGLEGPRKEPDGSTLQERVSVFLQEVAALSLEGNAHRSRFSDFSIRAAIPLHASSLLRHLATSTDGVLKDFRQALAATRDRPVEVTRPMRLVQLVATGCGLAVQMLLASQILVLLQHFGIPIETTPLELEKMLVLGTLATCWAFLTRGGWSFRIEKLAIVRTDGRLATRAQCAVRSLAYWVPYFGLLSLARLLTRYYPGFDYARNLLIVVALIGYGALVMWRPERSFADELAGTYVVPR